MRRPATGFSLIELIVAMTMIGVLTLVAAARFVAFRDAAAVSAASAETLQAFAMARELAVTRRSAVSVRLDTARGVVEVRSGGGLLSHRDLGASHGVALVTNRDSMVYDPRGIGYGVSNLSLIVRRGQAAETVTVSRLGRVR